jgi:hypothetical protein
MQPADTFQPARQQEPGRRRWREDKRRPIPGNSPNDRILRGPDCNRPKRVCANPFSATPPLRLPEEQQLPGMRFRRHTESIGPMYSLNHPHLRRKCRLPLVGTRASVKGRDGRSAPCSSSAMSSDRLSLDRVARQQSPSPLHRHPQTTMHSSPDPGQGDISTLHKKGTFLFCVDMDKTHT